MATQNEIEALGDNFLAYSDTQIEQANAVSEDFKLTKEQLGASTAIQDDVNDALALNSSERVILSDYIKTESGGSKKSHFPC